MKRGFLIGIAGAAVGALIALPIDRLVYGRAFTSNSPSDDPEWRTTVPKAVLKADGTFETEGIKVDANALLHSKQVQRHKAIVVRIGKEVQPRAADKSLKELKALAAGDVWVFEDVATATGAGFHKTLDLLAPSK